SVRLLEAARGRTPRLPDPRLLRVQGQDETSRRGHALERKDREGDRLHEPGLAGTKPHELPAREGSFELLLRQASPDQPLHRGEDETRGHGRLFQRPYHHPRADPGRRPLGRRLAAGPVLDGLRGDREVILALLLLFQDSSKIAQEVEYANAKDKPQ